MDQGPLVAAINPQESNYPLGEILDVTENTLDLAISPLAGKRLVVRQEITVCVGSLTMDNPLQIRAIVTSCQTDTPTGRCRLEFTDATNRVDQIALRHLFERRQDTRISLDCDEAPTVHFRLLTREEPEDGEHTSFEGRLNDLSACGLSANFSELNFDKGGLSDLVEITFSLPGNPLQLVVVAWVRHQNLCDAGTQVGVEFEPELSPDFEVSRSAIVSFVSERKIERGREQRLLAG